MLSILTKTILPYLMLGSAFMYLAPIVAPFKHVRISECTSIKQFFTEDNEFKHAVGQSRLETNKLFSKAKAHAGEIVTAML
jgi:hypothetical protein